MRGWLARRVLEREQDVARRALMDHVVAGLVDRWGEECTCPYCGGVNWNVGGLVELDRSVLQSPMVPVGCRACGATVLLDAATACK